MAAESGGNELGKGSAGELEAGDDAAADVDDADVTLEEPGDAGTKGKPGV